jgi:trehalose 6-phosphate phosphatase
VGYILSPRNRAVLKSFAQSRALVAFDFDGTLAPIEEDPFQVWIAPQTTMLLKRVSSLYPCVVISGRAREDVRRRLRGTGIPWVVGNHGADLGKKRDFRHIVAEWRTVVVPALAGLAGVWVEDKHLSLAVHYRKSPRKAEARRCILRVARHLAHVRVVPARLAVNLIPEDAPHKGIALLELQTRLGCDAALFVGDDVTDEDVFSLDGDRTLIGIRVGRKRASQARFWLHRQGEIDELLRLLVGLREDRFSSDKAPTTRSSALPAPGKHRRSCRRCLCLD